MIKTFDSNIPGPNLVIMAGVHGNEPCGIEAFEKLLPDFEPRIGKVTFIIGSPKAVEAGTREYDTNLNRMFRSDSDLTEGEKSTYEYERSRELMPVLAAADALLDIHSSSTEQTIPFVICESQSFEVAKILPVSVVVSGIDTLHPTGTDAYVNQTGGRGICIECGNHNAADAGEVAHTAIQSFLAYFGVALKADTSKNGQRYVQADYIYKNTDTFTLARTFTEFESLKEGELVGFDGSNEVYAPYDGVILFPVENDTPGKEAFLFGREEG